MAEHICLFNKGTLIFKPPKKYSPLVLRMAFLTFAMLLSIFFCSLCLTQIRIHGSTKPQRVHHLQRPSDSKYIKPYSSRPLLHYPKPSTFSRAECENNPVKLFAILSTQRSGSGWFETLLNSHANVSSNGEIFSVMDRRNNISSIIQTLDEVYNLDWLTSASKNECSAAVGLKWMLNQGLLEHHEQIMDYFNVRGVSAIFLFRRNLLRRLVSLLSNSYDRYAKQLNGTHKSHVHTVEEANALSKYKPTIDTDNLIADLMEMEETTARALDYFNSTRHMVLYYEDLMNNNTKLEDVLDFLELPKMELKSRQVKIHTGPLSEHIKNWNEVKETLLETVYEKFISS